jgi:hypothetical protein
MTMSKQDSGVLKKLIFRLDGTADSKKVEFTSNAGTRWEAELSIDSGTSPQSPNLMILFRNRDNVVARQRYTLVPPGYSKVPKEAAKQLTEEDLRELLAESVQV